MYWTTHPPSPNPLTQQSLFQNPRTVLHSPNSAAKRVPTTPKWLRKELRANKTRQHSIVFVKTMSQSVSVEGEPHSERRLQGRKKRGEHTECFTFQESDGGSTATDGERSGLVRDVLIIYKVTWNRVYAILLSMYALGSNNLNLFSLSNCNLCGLSDK